MAKIKSKEGIPQEYLDLIGKKQTVSGCVFSYKKEIKSEEFTVLDVRRGSAKVIDYEKMEVTNLTYELKLKNDSMSRAQWTKPFPDMYTDTSKIEL
jgi:hypothetical protein